MTDPASNPRVLLLGWFGSRERHLQPLRSFYEKRGADVVPFVADARTSFAPWAGYAEASAGLVEAVIRAEAEDPRPLVIHAFSNHGFFTALALLERLQGDRPELLARVVGLVFDSAPGIPDEPDLRFTMRHAPRLFMPSLLTALRRRPAHEHPILTPILSVVAGAIHLAAPWGVRALKSTVPRMLAVLARLPGRRALFFWGDADALVPHAIVAAFADSCERAGLVVERCFFPGSRHVRHLVEHRAEYLARVERFLDACAHG